MVKPGNQTEEALLETDISHISPYAHLIRTPGLDTWNYFGQRNTNTKCVQADGVHTVYCELFSSVVKGSRR